MNQEMSRKIYLVSKSLLQFCLNPMMFIINCYVLVLIYLYLINRLLFGRTEAFKIWWVFKAIFSI